MQYIIKGTNEKATVNISYRCCMEKEMLLRFLWMVILEKLSTIAVDDPCFYPSLLFHRTTKLFE
jgi:hypothetical protein